MCHVLFALKNYINLINKPQSICISKFNIFTYSPDLSSIKFSLVCSNIICSSFIERCTIARARFTRILNEYYAGYLYLEWFYTMGNFGEHKNLYVRDSALLYRRRNVLPRAPPFIPCFKIFTGSVTRSFHLWRAYRGDFAENFPIVLYYRVEC